MPDISTIFRDSSAKKVKLNTKPAIIKKGLVLLPTIEVANIKGKMGRIQGDRISAKPSKKASNPFV
jgi:hypothetical protein